MKLLFCCLVLLAHVAIAEMQQYKYSGTCESKCSVALASLPAGATMAVHTQVSVPYKLSLSSPGSNILCSSFSYVENNVTKCV